MKGVAITGGAAEITLDADDWELYTSTPALWAASGEAVAAINDALTASFSSGATRAEAHRAAWGAMTAHAGAGAADTEPRNVLEDVLDALYGRGDGA